MAKHPILHLDSGLTPEEEAYARARAFGMTAGEAMNFSTNGAAEGTVAKIKGATLETRNPLVTKRINELSHDIAERMVEEAGASKAWVIKRLMQVAERCMKAEPVMAYNRDTKEFEETGEYKFDSSGSNRALELIGKELQMFQTRVTVDVNHFAKMTDDQVKNKVNELAIELGMPLLEMTPHTPPATPMIIDIAPPDTDTDTTNTDTNPTDTTP